MLLRGQRLAQWSGPLLLFSIVMGAASCRSSSEAASASAAPSSDPASIREAQLGFVKNYIEAVRSQDIQKFEQTLHPKYRTCINPENQPFFANELSRESPPNTGYKVTSITPASQPIGEGLLPADGFPYPVRPTHRIQVDFEPTKDGTSLYSTVLEVAPDHGSWYLTGPCPNAKGMEFFHQQLQAGERQKADARKRVSELKDPLLSELKQMLQAHEKMQAIKKYSKETGADMTTAVQVIDQLESPDGH